MIGQRHKVIIFFILWTDLLQEKRLTLSFPCKYKILRAKVTLKGILSRVKGPHFSKMFFVAGRGVVLELKWLNYDHMNEFPYTPIFRTV